MYLFQPGKWMLPSVRVIAETASAALESTNLNAEGTAGWEHRQQSNSLRFDSLPVAFLREKTIFSIQRSSRVDVDAADLCEFGEVGEICWRVDKEFPSRSNMECGEDTADIALDGEYLCRVHVIVGIML